MKYNSDNKHWAYICSKGFFVGLIFGGASYWMEFCVSKWVGLDNINSLKHKGDSLKLLTLTVHGQILRGVGGGYLHLRFGGLIFGIVRYLP